MLMELPFNCLSSMKMSLRHTDTRLSLTHTPIILSPSTKIKRKIIQIHGIIASSTSFAPVFFPFCCFLSIRQSLISSIDTSCSLIFRLNKIKYLSLCFARFEKSKMKEIWFLRDCKESKNCRHYGSTNAVREIAKIKKEFFFRQKKAQTKITRNEHNESSEIFDRHFL